jgi:hypothetical protein
MRSWHTALRSVAPAPSCYKAGMHISRRNIWRLLGTSAPEGTRCSASGTLCARSDFRTLPCRRTAESLLCIVGRFSRWLTGLLRRWAHLLPCVGRGRQDSSLVSSLQAELRGSAQPPFLPDGCRQQ